MRNSLRCRAYCLLGAGILLTLTTSCALFNKQPVAVIAVSPDSGFAPLQVLLDGGGSYDPDGIVVTYEWTLGDGRTASGEQIDHAYLAAANYRVILRVTDDDGDIGRSEANILVSRFDLTGQWTGVIRNALDAPPRGPYALDLILYQQVVDNSLSGMVRWKAIAGHNISISIPIKSGCVTGTELHITASGLFSPNPDLFGYAWYSIYLHGRLEGQVLQGTGSWDDGTSFHWSAWKQ